MFLIKKCECIKSHMNHILHCSLLSTRIAELGKAVSQTRSFVTNSPKEKAQLLATSVPIFAFFLFLFLPIYLHPDLFKQRIYRRLSDLNNDEKLPCTMENSDSYHIENGNGSPIPKSMDMKAQNIPIEQDLGEIHIKNANSWLVRDLQMLFESTKNLREDNKRSQAVDDTLAESATTDNIPNELNIDRSFEHLSTTATKPIDVDISVKALRAASINTEPEELSDTEALQHELDRLQESCEAFRPRINALYQDNEWEDDNEEDNEGMTVGESDVFRPFGRLFEYASPASNRPVLWRMLSDLCTVTGALSSDNTIQSDATSLIGSILRKLLERIPIEGEQDSLLGYEYAFQLVIDLNADLHESYQWDPEKSQFTGPIDVLDFADWLSANCVLNMKDLDNASPWSAMRPSNFNPRIEKDNLEPQTCSNSKSITRSSRIEDEKDKDEKREEPGLDTVMRKLIEQAVTYGADDDTLDSIWSYSEDENQFDESDDDESQEGIFESATEISGADVTESDWSEVNRDSD
jgi:hypothetical protein